MKQCIRTLRTTEQAFRIALVKWLYFISQWYLITLIRAYWVVRTFKSALLEQRYTRITFPHFITMMNQMPTLFLLILENPIGMHFLCLAFPVSSLFTFSPILRERSVHTELIYTKLLSEISWSGYAVFAIRQHDTGRAWINISATSRDFKQWDMVDNQPKSLIRLHLSVNDKDDLHITCPNTFFEGHIMLLIYDYEGKWIR